MFTKRSREGYMLVDHRNSPGISPELIRASKLDVPIVGKNELYESATIQCCHCGGHVVRNPNRTRPRNWCMRCDEYVCDNPWCNNGCHPFKQRLGEAYEKTMRGMRNG